MRTTVLALPIFVSSLLNAQSWCPPGAEWSNTFSNGWTFEGFARFTFSGDTIIGSLPSQKIQLHAEGLNFGDPTAWDLGPYFTTVDGDLVSIWTAAGFDTLYHFGAVPGDHWNRTLADGSDSMAPLTIADTGNMVIDGVQLHFLVATDGDTIVERLGSLHHVLLPWVPVTLDAADGALRCYNDFEIDHVDPNWSYGCASLLGIEPENPLLELVPAPNPGTDQFTIELPSRDQQATVILLDVSGREVWREVLRSEANTVHTSSLSLGLYDYRICAKDGGLLAHGRWMKE